MTSLIYLFRRDNGVPIPTNVIFGEQQQQHNDDYENLTSN